MRLLDVNNISNLVFLVYLVFFFKMQLKCKFGTNGPLSLFEDDDEPLSFVGYSFSRSLF